MKLQCLVAALFGIVVAAGSAQAAVKVQTVDYKQGETALEGWLVYDDAAQGRHPGVVVYPQWMGPSAFEKNVAEKLVAMGYVAFVADIYGKGVRPDTPKAAGEEMGKYLKDRPLLLARAQAAFDQLRQSPMVDAQKLAAIGYCFGGAPALDLGRSGAALVDIVTFHGVLSTPDPANAKNIKGHVLALHGAADPIVNAQAVAAFEKEMTDAKVDWQVVLYGGAMHAFTLPEANSPEHGSQYDPAAAKRSWQAMSDLFKATL
ncbi:MAG TPA: dienelactone hydrolase family protein [Xanthobacteraceae bacterium]|jgi:dienelactone hydrolase|nr:dienelactone hydrolase family protein [Xanthobacteraceae bacterium]